MKIAITTPFANKLYCLEEYQKSIADAVTELDKRNIESEFYIWDNSNNPDFENQIKEWANKIFKKVNYFKDKTEHQIIETTADYGKVSDRCATIYKKMFNEWIDKDCDYIFNVEDDISFEGKDILKMIDILENPNFKEASAITGCAVGRRLRDKAYGRSMTWSFKINGLVFPPIPEQQTSIQINTIPEKPLGIEIIGSAHAGMLLMRNSVLQSLGWAINEDGVRGGDICFGYRLWKYKKGFYLVDWSIWAKHWFKDELGKADYFSVDKRGNPTANINVKLNSTTNTSFKVDTTLFNPMRYRADNPPPYEHT